MNSNTRGERFAGIGRSSFLFSNLAAALLVAAVAGCSILPQPTADPTRYYLLGQPTAAQSMGSATDGTLHIGLRNVELPAYLRSGRSIVLRRSTNEVHYEDFARWAEPLDAAVQRSVREKLLSVEGIASADTAPFVGEVRRDFDVAIRVVRCEGTIDGQGKGGVQFVASYDVFSPSKGGALVLRRTFVAPNASWNGTDFSQLVQRMSDAVAGLGADIAQNLPR